LTWTHDSDDVNVNLKLNRAKIGIAVRKSTQFKILNLSCDELDG
jgi:hypothetical protein